MRWKSTMTRREDEESLLHDSPSTPNPTTSKYGFHRLACLNQLDLVLRNALYQLLIFAIPTFLRQTLICSVASAEKEPISATGSQKVHATAYLDGVRGLASFIVFVFHWTHLQYPGVSSGYISSEQSSLWQLPVIRFVYSGPAMVAIFFVVSGYVLSRRFVQKMHRHEYESLFSGLSSLTFRRAGRLFLPALGSCILAYICASLHLIPIPGKVDHKEFRHDWPAFLIYLDSESNPWTWDIYMKGFYNPQLWSIAVEYRGSMVVFLIILGIAKTHAFVRMGLETAVVVHAFGHRRWDIALFIAGLLNAELDVFVNISPSRKEFMQKKRIKFLLSITMIVGVWLSGYPRDNGTEALGYSFSKNIWPHGEYRRRYWTSIASILVIGPMPYMPAVQSLFRVRLIRYLGKISFSLYLIHGLGNRLVGVRLLHLTHRMIGIGGFEGSVLSFIVSSLLYLPLVIWWSDMYWRAVDIPSMHFAKWLEEKCASRASS